MSREISNQEEFNKKLELLGALYEEGKTCLNKIYQDDPAHTRLYEILREMRDLTALNMQSIHWIENN